MNKLLYSFAAVLLAFGYGFAQDHNWCSANHKHQALYAENPQLEKDYEQLFLNGVTKDDNDTVVFTIPVVFHILHQYGVENISDAQVMDQMNILNRDYRLMNADTSQVIQAFKELYGDVRIEFKLATIDPFGNCTNGIERIYTHETTVGDDYSKLHQWNRSRYLNVWVVRSMEAGTAGYAYYPTATNNQSFWIDGINIRYNYIGSIEQGNVFSSRALTHEIGHYLGLAHLWGSTNEPMVACGDDNILDTPYTKGYDFCPSDPEDSKICNDTIYENYQNYMDYSYCSRMFTLGQIAAMRTILQGNDGFRSNLITPQTHATVGIDLTTPPTCIPIVDFNANTRLTCVGQNVTFSDESFNGPVTFREWTFQDGNPATSSDPNPVVSFNSFGLKTVTLTVGNASGNATKTFTQYISVANPWADFTGPQNLDLNSNHADYFRVLNPEENDGQFHLVNGVGKDNSRCFKLNTYKNVSSAVPFSDDFFYNSRLGGTVDALITPSFDLRTSSNVQFTFDYSYATNATNTADITEQVRVYYSRDCGDSWTPIPGGNAAILTGGNLVTGGYAGNTDYTPANNADWGTYSRNFTTTSQDDHTRFKIEFTASDLSSNLYIDNIFILGTLGVEDFATQHELVIAPNPVVSGSDLKIEYMATDEPVTFTLRNMQGQELLSTTRTEQNQPVSFSLEIDQEMPAAYYFLEVKSQTSTTVKKVVVIH